MVEENFEIQSFQMLAIDYTLFFNKHQRYKRWIGQKICTFCAPPLRLAFVKYQFSKYGYFMIYCKKETSEPEMHPLNRNE